MTSFDDVYALLHRSSDQLCELAATVDPTKPSYASEWTIAQVLSHLGSGAELTLNLLQAAFDGADPIEREGVWDRWNAYPPEKMTSKFVVADRALLDYVGDLDPTARDSATVQFFIGPTDVATTLAFRLAEHALHNWDVRVALDPSAVVDGDAAALILGVVTPVMVGFTADKQVTARLAPATIAIESVDADLVVGEQVALRRPGGGPSGPDVTATLAGPAESVLRLVSGRLDPDHTPDAVSVEGSLTLQDLRALFPGY